MRIRKWKIYSVHLNSNWFAESTATVKFHAVVIDNEFNWSSLNQPDCLYERVLSGISFKQCKGANLYKLVNN